MGVEASEVLVTATCDGPACDVTAQVPAGPDPIPQDWLATWGPGDRLGRFLFHSGACYDDWRADLEQERNERAEAAADRAAAAGDD